MPRTPRLSFPNVHSLYLSDEQDGQLRRYARRSRLTVSDVMRAALDEYLRREPRPAHEGPTESETRHAIAESARARRDARGPGRAPVLPRQQLADRTPIWQPPTRAHDDDTAEHPLARDDEGRRFQLPSNAVAWLVLEQRRAQDAPTPLAWRRNHQMLVIALETTQRQLVHLIGRRPGSIVLHPVDDQGRLLRARQAVLCLYETD